MRAIDTNVLVRLIVRDDARQIESAERFIRTGASVPILTLVETIWVLGSVYNRGRADIARTVEMLLEHESLVLQDRETIVAALALFRAQTAPGFSDCLVLEIARKSGHLPLGTFDRALSRAPAAQRLRSAASVNFA